jgi:hypothetical protein
MISISYRSFFNNMEGRGPPVDASSKLILERLLIPSNGPSFGIYSC